MEGSGASTKKILSDITFTLSLHLAIRGSAGTKVASEEQRTGGNENQIRQRCI